MLCLLLEGTCQWELMGRLQDGGRKPLLASSSLSETTKSQPIIPRSSLWFAVAHGLPDGEGLGTIQVQMPEMSIILEISQHGASTSNCLLSP